MKCEVGGCEEGDEKLDWNLNSTERFINDIISEFP